MVIGGARWGEARGPRPGEGKKPEHVFSGCPGFGAVLYRETRETAHVPTGRAGSAAPSGDPLNDYTCAGQLAYRQGLYTEAYDLLQSAAERRLQDADVLYWLGMSAMKLEQYAEAEQIFKQAIHYEQRRGRLRTLYIQSGICQREQHKIDEARQSFHAALRYATNGSQRNHIQDLLEEVP